MTTREDVKAAELELFELVTPETSRSADTGREPCGRIVHDERGNAVWKWFGETSTTHSTSGILEYFDPIDLEVEGQGIESGGGYDPYNQCEPRTEVPKTGSRSKP